MDSSPKRKPRRWVLIAALGAIAIVIALFVGLRSSANSQGIQPTCAVAKGPLVISVSEPGQIKSKTVETIKSEVEGQTTILTLVAEGSRVKKGDLLVELDASRLQDSRVDKAIAVQNAEANFIRAREQLEVIKNQSKADMEKAKLDYEFAQEDLVKYEKGDYPTAKKEAEMRVSLAKDDLAQKAEKLKQSKELYDKSFASLADVQADDLAMKRAENELETATQELTLLVTYTHKRRVAELSSNQDQTRMALERATRKATADVVQGEADLRAKQSEFERQKAQLAKIDKQIEKCKMYAPTDGLVVYATTGQQNFRANAEPLAEGTTVRERQDLIYLPTTSSVIAEIKLHESTLDRARIGLPVRVTVDALPGRVYSGTVTKIAPLPDAQSMWMNPDMKVFNSEVTLDSNDDDSLRTGMSCRAEVIVETYAEAMYVPVQSVLRVNGAPTVYVKNGEKVEPRKIEVGLDNNRMAHVKGGLNVGELVLLNPPLADASALAEHMPPPTLPTVDPKKKPGSEAKPEGGKPVADNTKPRDQAPDPQPAPKEPQTAAAPNDQPQAGDNQRPRRGMGNMTPEQREEMRKRLENMTPEEREKMREEWTKRRQQMGGDGAQGGGPGTGGGPGGGGRRNRGGDPNGGGGDNVNAGGGQ